MASLKAGIFLFLWLFISSLLCAQERIVSNKILFEPGNISTMKVEYGTTFTPDGKEIYFARSDQEWGKGTMKSTIYHAFFDGEKWSTPQIASFSGIHDDSDPHISLDGKNIYFISKRPSLKSPISSDIWMAKRKSEGGWTKPVRLPNPINSEKNEYGPVTDAAGNLYFASDRPGGFGQGDLYTVPQVGGAHKTPINMGKTLNSATGEWNLGVSPDGNTIIFEASQRTENSSPYGDLYISFKRNNLWTAPQNVRELNTTGSDLYPVLLDSGQLYFSSSDSLKSGDTNIYRVDFSEILKKYSTNATGISIPEKHLTKNKFEDRYASYSPDGESIVFESNRDGSWEIFLMDKNGGNVQQLTATLKDSRRPTWHPDGKKVLFESTRNGKPALYTFALKNKKVKKLFDPNGEYEPIFAMFSPNGKTIAVSLKETEEKSNIVLVGKNGKIKKRITRNDQRNYYPKWSHDGKEIVYFSRKDTNNQDDEIYSHHVLSGLDRRLTVWPKHNFCPSWSNDGAKVVYVSSMEGARPEIYVMDADGNNPQRLTYNENGETLPNWHPTQNKILVTAYRNGNYEICELEL